MSFDSAREFFEMGGHGLYVWLAYGAAVLVVLQNTVSVARQRRRFFRDARALQARRGGEPAQQSQSGR